MNWPSTVPFHKGEVAVQQLLQVHDHVMSYAPKVIRPYMPDQHRDFYTAQPFLVVAARDDQDRLWSTLLASTSADMITSPDPQTLLIDAQPVPGDALEGNLTPGKDIGIIGIEFSTRRRNRVNGRLAAPTNTSNKGVLEFQVDQSFGNCPQYIKPRKWWVPADHHKSNTTQSHGHPNKSISLSESQMKFVQKAETIFLATGYRGEGEDPRYGNDASHRGGPPGFVHVRDSKTLILPDFAGNNHYNSIGNLVLDSRIGVTFPNYETGGMVQVTGTANVDFDYVRASSFYPGAQRLIEVSIDEVVQVPDGSIPIRWTSDLEELRERTLVVSSKIQESEDVVSFHLQPLANELQALWPFQPGQHLPISLQIGPFGESSKLERTYSLSSAPDSLSEYRISVKRQGKASNFLHDHVQVGDTLQVSKPSGDFVLQNNERPLVLLSNGIGATPMISMLHHTATSSLADDKTNKRRTYWFHGARDSQHDVFQAEFKELQRLAGDSIRAHRAYSQPLIDDQFDSKGRLSPELLQDTVPDLKQADIYICGSDAFVADMEEGLRKLQVPAAQIHNETF